jgi:hypothetical protein
MLVANRMAMMQKPSMKFSQTSLIARRMSHMNAALRSAGADKRSQSTRE